VILTGLQSIGLLNKDSKVDDMLDDRVCYYFMPHGLGHLIGLEVHDVGGYLSFTPQRSDQLGLKSLRTSRYLAEGNVITIEPGIYFREFLLERAFKNEKISHHFVPEVIKEYYNFGGVRIEDLVFIDDERAILLNEGLPRTTEEIEKLMSS